MTESISQMLCSHSIDLGSPKIESGECLWEISGYTSERYREKCIFAMLSRKALAKCFVPLSPISFHRRSSVVSVYVRKVDMSREEVEKNIYSPCYFENHQPDIASLLYQYNYVWDQVKGLSTWEKRRCQGILKEKWILTWLVFVASARYLLLLFDRLHSIDGWAWFVFVWEGENV
jgi:hypothetical protein